MSAVTQFKADKATIQRIAALEKYAVTDKELRVSAGKAADFAADFIRDVTPRGPTGNLRKAIKGRMMRAKGQAMVYIARRDAPHAHLVEYGTRERVLSTPRKAMIRGRMVTITTTGRMPASGWWAKATRRSSLRVRRLVAADIARRLERKERG